MDSKNGVYNNFLFKIDTDFNNIYYILNYLFEMGLCNIPNFNKELVYYYVNKNNYWYNIYKNYNISLLRNNCNKCSDYKILFLG